MYAFPFFSIEKAFLSCQMLSCNAVDSVEFLWRFLKTRQIQIAIHHDEKK